MGVIPINISPPSSQTPSSTASDASSDNDDEEEINHNYQRNDPIQDPDEQIELENHLQDTDKPNEPVTIEGVPIQYQEEQIEPLPNASSENEYQMNLIAEPNISETTSSSVTSISTSNDSFNSAKSNNSSTPTPSPDPQVTQRHIEPMSDPLPLRYNDIAFIDEINNLDKTTKGKPKYVISSVRPSFSCSADQDFFLCHLCHSFPKQGDRWEEDRNEYPFVRNIVSIWRHLRINHCRKNQEEKQLHYKVEAYILSIKKNLIANPDLPLLQTKTSIPKSLSTSCLKTAWKSNQT